MDFKNLIIIFLALVVFGACAYLVFEYGMFLSEPLNQETIPSKEYLSFLEKYPQNYYSKEYLLDLDGLEKTMLLIQNQEGKYFQSSAVFYTEKIYFLDNETIMCLTYGKKERCAKIEESQELKKYADSKLIEFPSKELSEKDIAISQFLLEKGAMNFSQDITEINVSNIPCTLLEYSLDFKKLSIEDLSKVGMTSAQLEVYSNFKNQVCFDENGDKLFSNLTYLINAIPTHYTRTLLKTDSSGSFEIPKELSNESQLMEFFGTYQNTEKAFYACIYDENPENCFKTEGVYSDNEAYCQMAGSKKDDCILIVGTKKLDFNLCLQIIDLDKKDDCILEISSKLKTNSYCQSIENSGKKETCLSFTQGQ
ncbi:MAG: hypothetical protein WC501_04045 [Candidatus Micrarchaeia archaeon]